jgi:iron-sulfur cluster insertion protein
MIITENTVNKVKEVLAEEGKSDSLRIFVQGGGCSGMSYGFALEDTQNDDDFVIEQGGIKFLVDAMSMQYLNDATIDYKEDLTGANFVIDNPMAETTCGCGSSFSVSDTYYDDHYPIHD